MASNSPNDSAYHLRRDNYAQWKAFAPGYLASKNLWSAVNPASTEPVNPDQDMQAKYHLTCIIAPDVALEFLSKPTAKEMYAAIKEKFDTTSIHLATSIYNKLQGIRYESCSSLQDFVAQKEKAILSLVLAGRNLTDADKISLILSGLPAEIYTSINFFLINLSNVVYEKVLEGLRTTPEPAKPTRALAVPALRVADNKPQVPASTVAGTTGTASAPSAPLTALYAETLLNLLFAVRSEKYLPLPIKAIQSITRKLTLFFLLYLQ